MGGNVLMIEYLQRALGYSLTGETSERAIFVAHGNGDNGKSTLLDLVCYLFREYSTKIMIDTLMSVLSSGNNAKADLANLRGVRFASTSEPERSQRFGGVLKQITQGNGTITAARKHENPIQFPESHKLWIDCNGLPDVANSDDALWKRLHPIYFAVTIPKHEIDPQLREKLRDEAEGILTWLAEGAHQWYAKRLAEPDAIAEARQNWRERSEFNQPYVDAERFTSPGRKPTCECGTCQKCTERERKRDYRERTMALQ